MSEDNGQYDVGYGKPPRETQFRKGRSGNPAGRPKREGTAEFSLPALMPTASAIRQESNRKVSVKSSNGQEDLTMTEVVVRSLGNKAATGSILAQRTYLQLQMAEDEREYRCKERRFDQWRKYVVATRSTFDRAEARGDPEPKLYPHPADVQLDYQTLDVRILGPLSEDDAKTIMHTRRVSLLALELAIFCGDGTGLDELSTDDSKIGIWMLQHSALQMRLPPRLRGQTPDEEAAMYVRMSRPGRHWEPWLRKECSELAIPFLKLGHDSPTWKLSEIRRKVARAQRRRKAA